MTSEDSIKYTVHELWSYFSEPPGELLCCPACENSISIKTIGPSKAVSKYYPDRFLHEHKGILYKCKRCAWWAVRESWLDYELNVDPDYLVVGEFDGTQERLPWRQVLEIDNLYEKPMPLPHTIGRCFSHGKRRKERQS